MHYLVYVWAWYSFLHASDAAQGDIKTPFKLPKGTADIGNEKERVIWDAKTGQTTVSLTPISTQVLIGLGTDWPDADYVKSQERKVAQYVQMAGKGWKVGSLKDDPQLAAWFADSPTCSGEGNDRICTFTFFDGAELAFKTPQNGIIIYRVIKPPAESLVPSPVPGVVSIAVLLDLIRQVLGERTRIWPRPQPGPFPQPGTQPQPGFTTGDFSTNLNGFGFGITNIPSVGGNVFTLSHTRAM